MENSKFVNILKKETKDIDISEEFTLPEYLADMVKILDVGCRIKPVGKFVTETSVQANADVLYTVLYYDEENKIAQVMFSSELEAESGIETGVTADEICTDIAVKSKGYRMLSPRKISLKCKAEYSIYYNYPADLSLKCVDFKGEVKTEKKTEETEYLCAKFTEERNAEFEDGISTKGNRGDITELIDLKAMPTVISAEAKDNGIGEITIGILFNALCKSADNKYVSISQSIKKTYQLDIEQSDGKTPEHLCARVTLNELKGGLSQENSDENNNTINITYSLDICLLSFYKCRTEFVLDAYCADAGEETEYDKINLTENAEFINTQPILYLNKPFTEADKIICTTQNAIIDRIKPIPEKEKSIAEGSVKYRFIYENEKGNVDYVEYTEPFSVEINAGLEGKQIICEASGIISVSTEITDGMLKVQSVLSIDLCIIKTKEREYISQIKYKEAEKKSECGILIYFPLEKENCFDIAKKYHIEQGLVIEENIQTGTAQRRKVIIPLLKNK